MVSERMKQRADFLCEVMKEVSGIDPKEKTRRREVVNARMMVAQVLLDAGYIEADVATLVGRDRGSVRNYREKMKWIHLPMFEAEAELWKRFKNAAGEDMPK